MSHAAWRTERARIAQLVEDVKVWSSNCAEIVGCVEESSWPVSIGSIRHAIAVHGKSVIRIFSPRYRQAVTDLRSLCRGEPPRKIKDRLALLAKLIMAQSAPRIPCVVGYEVSGTVDAVGPGSGQSWIDRDVFALTRFGGYSDVVVVPEKHVFPKPASLSHEQVAAIPVNYLTAWQLLVVMGSLKREETVLVHNVGGGVGLAAIDIARHIGSTIYGTASSAKHAFLFERGVHEAIDYRAKDWVVELDRLTNGKGVALITDPLGGNHWKKSYKALRSTGRLGMFGVSVATTSKLPGPLRLLPLALGTPFFHPLALMNANKSVFGVNLGHMWHESDMIAGWMEILLKGVADGWVRPHVDKSFPLAQAGEAQTYIEERKNIGKVVLTT